MGVIKKVWIEEGCISCNVCQDGVPEVFFVEDGEDCVVLENAPASFSSKDEEIRDATLDCPVEVIHFDEE